MPEISVKHALTHQELRFCRVYLAFGEKRQFEAYKRVFLRWRSSDGRLVEGEEDELQEDLGGRDTVSTEDATKRASALLKEDHIGRYIEEMKRPSSVHARQVLAEQALFGEDTAARHAADRIIAQEDKLGFRDATEMFWEKTIEAGAEIEVPLPGNCPHCGGALYARAPLAGMFPRLVKEGDGDSGG